MCLPLAAVDLIIYLTGSGSLFLVAVLIQLLIRDESHRFNKYVTTVKITKYVLLWYMISVSFTLANKFVLKCWQGNGFPFPIFLTTLHMVFKFLLTRVMNFFARPERKVSSIPFSQSLRSAVPIGICTGCDVAFSNLSFLFISVTFYTILKAGSLLWILVWAIVFNLEEASAQIFVICVLVSGGVGLASYGESAFSWPGLVLVMTACCVNGIRWAMVQVMLEGGGRNGPRQDRMYDPFEVLYHISPASALAVLPVFLMLELKPLIESPFMQVPNLVAEVMAIILLGGGIAFLLILVEIKLVKLASSLTVGFFGSIKEIVQIILSVLVFHDKLTVLNIVGLFLALLGTLLYRNYKVKMEELQMNSATKENGPYSAVQLSLSGPWTDDLNDNDEEENIAL